MRFVPQTTPHPKFIDRAGIPLRDDQPLSDPQKSEFLAWVRQNCHIVTDPVKLALAAKLTPQTKGLPCWEWQGATDKNQGSARYMNYPAHSYIFKRLNTLLHQDPATLGRITRVCRNPLCVNPAHCQLSEGPRTKHNRRVNEKLEQDPLNQEHATPGATGNATPSATHTTNTTNIAPKISLGQQILDNIKELKQELKALKDEVKTVKDEMKTLRTVEVKEDELADAVVAELLRVKLDELIASAIRGRK